MLKEVIIGTVYKSSEANDIVRVTGFTTTPYGTTVLCSVLSDPEDSWSQEEDLQNAKYGGLNKFKEEYTSIPAYNTPLWRALNES